VWSTMTLLFIYFHECVSDDLTMVTECRLYERDWSGVGKRESLLGTVCVCVCVCGWVGVGRRFVFRRNARSHAQVVRTDQREFSKSLRKLRTCPCNAPTVSCIRVSIRLFAPAQAIIRPNSDWVLAVFSCIVEKS
jgi:hypothetical protein